MLEQLVLPLSLSAPISVSRNLKVTKGIAFSTELLLFVIKKSQEHKFLSDKEVQNNYQDSRSTAEETSRVVQVGSLAHHAEDRGTQHFEEYKKEKKKGLKTVSPKIQIKRPGWRK
jgi:hypothetical protein